jgi:hypothetical protein
VNQPNRTEGQSELRIFLSGIISGSLGGNQIHQQSYRDELRAVLKECMPAAQILCPWDMHPDALNFSPGQAREALAAEVEAAATSDVVVAYIPQASMGTAIEIWEANKRGVPVLAITPLIHNWVVMLTARQTFPTIEDFAEFARSGGLAAFASER